MSEVREPVKYTVLERSLVGNTIYEEGATVEYAGLPAENLAPQCDVGKARYQEYLVSNDARVAKMKADNAIDGDPEAFAKAVSTAIAEANAKFQETQGALISEAVAAAIAKVFPNGTGKKAVDPAGDPAIA